MSLMETTAKIKNGPFLAQADWLCEPEKGMGAKRGGI
jgi:hypothetical protein